jgi:transaldolase/glucose-6-phosphate isomerase
MEELIGANTVNTAPPHTIEAFKDHGFARYSVEENLTGMHQIINDLEALGISLIKITTQLENEGIRDFTYAYNEIITTIEERCKE